MTFRVGSQPPTADTSSPYTWTTAAPSVSQPTDLQVTATLNDLSGNRLTVSRTIHVLPLNGGGVPVVTLSGCWSRGGYATPGVALNFPFVATDNQAVQSYALIVDGVTLQTVYTNTASVSSSFNWTPPAGAAAGTVFNLRVQATDFAGGVGHAEVQLIVPQGTLAPQSLTSARNGQSLILGSGTFTVQEPLSLASLTLLSGAKLTGLAGQPLTLTVAGALRVQCGASIDISNQGYLGGVTANSPGGAPAGVAVSAIDAGGSHGGLGTLFTGAGPVGEVFGSVYQPRFGGGGGSLRAVATNRHGGNGGGAVVLDVGELVLHGNIWALGEGKSSGGQSEAGGAGGSVLVLADVISGAGFIDASGGQYRAGGSTDAQKAGSGGGGRVALYADSLVGFDPAAQVKAWGGLLWDSGGFTLGYGGPGTVFVKLPSQTYGRLIVDQGATVAGKPVANTPLPLLGSGDVLLVEAAGADAWVTAGTAFKPQWAGAWMALEGSGGTSLGSFRVLQLDGVRALLQDAAAAAAATRYRGQYRFDQVDFRNNVGLTSQDDLELGAVTAYGTSRLPKRFSASSMTVKAGAVVSPAEGRELDATVSGVLTVEASARIDASGFGYLGGVAANSPGEAPAGVTASAIDAGGSHGGLGTLYSAAGPIGEVFGSVYQPRYSGGGGSLRTPATGRHGGNGGGVVVLNVGELALYGEIRAQGEGRTTGGQSEAGGAGGSVLVLAGLVRGTGLIDVSGGQYRPNDSSVEAQKAGSGGGGRVALYVDAFSGFDPAAQVKAWGGLLQNSSAFTLGYGGHGTVFVKLPSQTYGRLIMDNGKESNGVLRTGASTPLPALGSGDVLQFEAAGADAWVTAGAAFKPQWTGAWMALETAGGNPLGSFRVLQLDGARVLLQDAATATSAARYRGRYRFDQVDFRNGASLTSQDELELGAVVAEGKNRLPKRFSASSMTVKAGAVVSPAEGSELDVTVSGVLNIEATGRIDASGLGYLGGVTASSPGGAPAGVTASAIDAGGSHGGLGTLYSAAGPVGEVFGSVYQPRFGGGGGSLRTAATGRHGGNGGGVVALDVGQLVLNGEIRAQGEGLASGGQSEAGGAGGSVLVLADAISGAGIIDVSGGQYRPNDSNVESQRAGSGGGGRVALYADSLVGFDPAAQVKAWGGLLQNSGASNIGYGGHGTVFVKLPSQVYGRLILDNGALRTGAPTPLPVLGSGDVLLVEAAGADAWVTAGSPFKPQWTGAWMALEDADGAALGSFRVLQLDGARALLQDAAAVTGAARYRGRYRFDQVDFRNNAGLTSQDELELGTVTAYGTNRLPKRFSAGSMTVKTGAVVSPAEGRELDATVGGVLTVEASARIDVSGFGYLGGVAANSPGEAPAGVTASAIDAGGSHGGLGTLYSAAGPVGEVFGSVYQPRHSGGGGSLRTPATGRHGGNGGGVVVLNVGELALFGEIRAQGEGKTSGGLSEAGGAGGSVLVLADLVRGTGLIDVSGGQYRPNDSTVESQRAGSGGGGRVALYVDAFSGFDPVAQTRTRGGLLQNSGASTLGYASPGTVYVKLPSQTYGRLIVDQGGIVAGKPIANTPLPSIGAGVVGTVTADTLDPTALWIEPADPTAKLGLGVSGMWVRVGVADYRVIDQSADRRRLLLAGAAGTVQGGDGYRGVYKFDEIVVRGGSKLEFRDTNAVGTSTVDATSSVIQNVP